MSISITETDKQTQRAEADSY